MLEFFCLGLCGLLPSCFFGTPTRFASIQMPAIDVHEKLDITIRVYLHGGWAFVSEIRRSFQKRGRENDAAHEVNPNAGIRGTSCAPTQSSSEF
jgi:hypothetical protein